MNFNFNNYVNRVQVVSYSPMDGDTFTNAPVTTVTQPFTLQVLNVPMQPIVLQVVFINQANLFYIRTYNTITETFTNWLSNQSGESGVYTIAIDDTYGITGLVQEDESGNVTITPSVVATGLLKSVPNIDPELPNDLVEYTADEFQVQAYQAIPKSIGVSTSMELTDTQIFLTAHTINYTLLDETELELAVGKIVQISNTYVTVEENQTTTIVGNIDNETNYTLPYMMSIKLIWTGTFWKSL